VHSITHRTKAKHEALGQVLRYCSAIHRSIYIAMGTTFSSMFKIVRMYATKLLSTWVKQMSNANYVHRLHVGIVSIQYTWSQKFSSMPWVKLVCMHWTACVVSIIMLYIVYRQKTKVVSVSSYSHMLPSLAYLHIHTSCTNQYGILNSAALMYDNACYIHKW